MQKMVVKLGVVIERGGAYWFELRDGENGYRTGFGPIEQALICEPAFCKKPTDATYKSSPDVTVLEKARLVPIKVTTIYEVG